MIKLREFAVVLKTFLKKKSCLGCTSARAPSANLSDSALPSPPPKKKKIGRSVFVFVCKLCTHLSSTFVYILTQSVVTKSGFKIQVSLTQL